MPILGAHMSIAGGYYRAVEAACRCRCDCVQIFTKNNAQWRAKPVTDEDCQRFQDALRNLRIVHPIAHSCYLINPAAPDRGLWKKSVAALVVELQRAQQLGVPYVVLHPGSYTSSSEVLGIGRIARALDEVHRQTPDSSSALLLETTAGQGSSLGWRFEHLAAILDTVKNPNRLGVCFDTCHVFAAGYPLAPAKLYRATMRQFHKVVGIEQIKAIHLNDSRRPQGSRVDRHEHIGRGAMGCEPFRLLLNDRRFRRVPMYLETPKGEENGQLLDQINLQTLRQLASGADGTRPTQFDRFTPA